MKLEEGLYRLGSRYVNFYAIEEAGRLTIVDTGIPGYWDQIPQLLDSIGRKVEDVVAIVQTHSHSDHIGCTERLRAASGATVFVHEKEGPVLRGEEKPTPPKGIAGVLIDPTALRMIGHLMTKGGLKFPKVQRLETFTDGDTLDVPGKLRAVWTPGHSAGHTSLVLEQQRVLFSGDAIVTRGLKGRTGPQLLEINVDRDEARRSLDRFGGIDTQLLLPGHGEPWRGSPGDAAEQARR
jgi:glyoxylase-like metal-dependent hydrolase (beta-lactamase superfamily II)